MAVPAWFWPPSGMQARGVSIAPYGSGLAVADWTTPRLFPFNPVSGFSAPIVYATGTPGLSSIAPDGAGGAYSVSYDGIYRQGTGSGVPSPFTLATGYVYTAMNTQGHFLSSDGSVWFVNTYPVLPVQNLQGTWPTPAVGLTTSGGVDISLSPASGILMLMRRTPLLVTGQVTLPASITVPSCVAAMSGFVAVGGWQNAATLSGMAAAALDPADSTSSTMLAVGSGNAVIWSAPAALSSNWTQSQLLTGFANLNAMCWLPDGIGALATSVVSGSVQVIGYVASVLSLLQTLSVTGACSVAVAGDSAHALVAQSGQSQAATLILSGASWVTGSPVTGLAGITAVAPFGVSGAVAAFSGGVATLGLVAGTWELLTTTSVGFTPTAITVDPFYQVYTAGSGALAVLSGATFTGSGTWAGGAATSIAAKQRRAIITDPTSGTLWLFGESPPGTWTAQSGLAFAANALTGIGLSETIMFLLGSGATRAYEFSGAPYSPTRVTSGVAAVWNGTTWASAALGVGNSPSSVAFDASGNAWLSTVQNTLWSISSGGAVLSSGQVPVFSGQTQTTPVGLSCVAPASGHIYVATSYAGYLTEAA